MFHKGFLESEFDWTGYLLSVTLPKCLEYFEIIWTRIPQKKYWSKDQRMVTTSFPAMSHIMPPYQRYCCLNHQTPSQVPIARNSASSTSRSSSPWVKLLTSRCALVIFQHQTWGFSHQKRWFHHQKWGFNIWGWTEDWVCSERVAIIPKNGKLGKLYGKLSNLGVWPEELNSSKQLV